MRTFLIILIVLLSSLLRDSCIYSQGCCSGGCGSPIAGGASPGVLFEKQIEIGSSFQYINGNDFFAGNKDTTVLFDNFNSRYIYSRVAYGVSKDLTFSAETGYFLNKTQIGLDGIDTVRSKGIGDLILFPKYDVYNSTNEKRKVEFTLGLGYKIPLGKHNDSTFTWYDSTNMIAHYTTSPPLVQPTTGTQDVILYAFFFRGFPEHKFRLFSNATFIHKGWNSLGQKFGNYTSIGVFAGKTFFENLSLTVQVKGEIIGKMQADKNIDMLALYNIDMRSTGSKKIFVVPQLSYSYKAFSIYSLYEIPIYQFVNGAQVVTSPLTIGISYKFFASRKFVPVAGETYYICPMKCEGSMSRQAGKCPVCGMELVPQQEK